MLYSQFFVDADRYVISVNEIVEIIPVVSLKSIAMMPDYVAGLMNYHGNAIPVIDLCQLLIGRNSRKILSTRIIVAKKVNSSSAEMLFGFMVEKATEMVVIDENNFKPQAMKNLESPTSGPVALYQEYLVEKISVDAVVDRLDEELFFEADTSENT